MPRFWPNPNLPFVILPSAGAVDFLVKHGYFEKIDRWEHVFLHDGKPDPVNCCPARFMLPVAQLVQPTVLTEPSEPA